MREHGNGYEHRCTAAGAALPESIEAIANGGPHQRADQAMCVRHVIKVERIGRGYSRDDADLLDPEQNEWSPENVEQLDREKEDPQGNVGFRSLCREAHAVVANEHGFLIT